MSEAKLGFLIDGVGQRDAIHIAIAPVVANESLTPGQHVGLVISGDQENVGPGGIPIGIVDPFLKEPVLKGQRFWMVLYPKTITGLRHEWTHPAFGAALPLNQEAFDWMTGFASSAGYSYEELMKGTKRYILNGEVLANRTGTWEWDLPEEFWKHYSTLTGEVHQDRGTIFECCPP